MKMNQPLVVCFIILAVHTCSYSASSAQHMKAINKRLINGSPINESDLNWVFTATLDIFHFSNGAWLRHPVCLGTFFQIGMRNMVITAANCFFPPGYDHTQFSYMSKNNYRVFLGAVRIRYGTRDYSNVNRFGLKSSVHQPIVIIHRAWQFGNSTEDTNIAIIPISSNCIEKLNEAQAKGIIKDLPQFQNLPESDELVGDYYCAVVGWKTDLPDVDLFAPERVHTNLYLTTGQFVPLNSSTCNRHFSSIYISKKLEDSQFCLSRIYGECVDVYFSRYEYGSGVICNGLWSGFISAIFSTISEDNVHPHIQLATVVSNTAIRRFFDSAHIVDGSNSCMVSEIAPTNFGKDPKAFNPRLAKDYASP